MRVKLAVLISGHGGNLQALMDASHEADYPGLIVLVISNRDAAFGLVRAKQADIPTAVLPHQHYPDRTSYDRALDAILTEHGVEFICLAGFMRILSPWLTRKWAGRMVNIHPSLLPAYKGLDTHRRVIEAGEKRHGCTVHWVTEALDSGATIAQLATDIRLGETPEQLKERVHMLEHQLYPEALRAALMEYQQRRG
jgi:phosphoribosylglycinamide formyltransferase-1